MKQEDALPWAPGRSEVANQFMRGFVASGLLSALQQAGRPAQAGPAGSRVLKHAFQGGSAIAAGVAAANALQSHRYSHVLPAVATGAAGILAAEVLGNPTRDSEKRSKPMSKKKCKKAYKQALKNGYNPEGWLGFGPPYAGAHGRGEHPLSKDFLRNLPGTFTSRQGQRFLLGALVGAGAAYVLGNEKLRGKFMKSILKLYSGVASGFEEFKEQLADLQAEIEAESSSTE